MREHRRIDGATVFLRSGVQRCDTAVTIQMLEEVSAVSRRRISGGLHPIDRAQLPAEPNGESERTHRDEQS
jgi:hypothetical protein